MTEDFNPKKYTANPDIHFKDIRNEEYRTYVFPPTLEGGVNNEISVERPEAVAFKSPQGTFTAGGSHRVIDKGGKAWYIPAGWIGIYWEKAGGLQAYEW